jgi:hypothetical protein
MARARVWNLVEGDLWITHPTFLSCPNLSTIFGAEILTSRRKGVLVKESGEAGSEILVEGIEELLSGEPGLVGPDQRG